MAIASTYLVDTQNDWHQLQVNATAGYTTEQFDFCKLGWGGWTSQHKMAYLGQRLQETSNLLS